MDKGQAFPFSVLGPLLYFFFFYNLQEVRVASTI